MPTRGLLGLLPSKPQPAIYLKKKFKFGGKITNRAIDYELKIETNPANPLHTKSTLISKSEEIFTGQMIVQQDCKTITVLEKDQKGNITFYNMTPL